MTDNENDSSSQNNKYDCWVKTQPTGYKLLLFIMIIVIVSLYSFYNFSKPKLVIPRYNHSAVVLQDGRILITGGETIVKGKTVTLNTAEIYDPKTKKCTLIINKMNYERSNHFSVLLPNGNVLILGGDKYNMTSELFDLKSNKFINVVNFTKPKQNIIAQLVNDNSVLIIDSHSKIVDLYDITKKKYTKIMSLNGIFFGKTNCLLFQNKIIFPVSTIMQCSSTDKFYTTGYYINLNNYSIEEIKHKKINQNNRCCRFNSFLIAENNLIQFCSDFYNTYAETYNFKQKSFENISNMIPASSVIFSSIGNNNKAILISEEFSKMNSKNKFIIKYDAKKNKIESVKCIKNIYDNSSFVQSNNKIYSIGGYISNNIIDTKRVTNKIEEVK